MLTSAMWRRKIRLILLSVKTIAEDSIKELDKTPDVYDLLGSVSEDLAEAVDRLSALGQGKVTK